MKPEIKTSTWLNGQKMHETPYIHGQRHGLATWWYDNGQKWHEIPYIHGQRHGLATWWHDNGQKWFETPYVNGRKHGLCTGWLSNSVLRYMEKWHQGQRVWGIGFIYQKQIPEDAEVELFLG